MNADFSFSRPDARERMRITRMTQADIPDVTRIETLSFPTSWPRSAFTSEISSNRLAHYFVGRVGNEAVAYGGIWIILEDSHVTTIAVHPDWRRRNYGEEVFLHMVQAAIEHNASWMTLEVRESNIAAQKLYRKYGFTTVSTRNSYYTDNHENALVMWAGNLRGALYRNKVYALRAALEAEILGGKR